MNIKRKSIRFLIWWSNLQLIPFIGVTLLLTYIIMIPSIPFVHFFACTENEFTYIRAISALTLAPFIETLIFQALVIYLISKPFDEESDHSGFNFSSIFWNKPQFLSPVFLFRNIVKDHFSYRIRYL